MRTRARTRARSLLAAAAGGAALLALAACTPKYAVLLSSNRVTADDVAIHSEWWYDLVLQYEALRESGFADDHIYVVYGDGQDFATAHPQFDAVARFGHPITTLPMSKANVQAVFRRVDAAMRRRGYLYVWWMGHGGGGGPDQCDLTMYISNTGETLSDAELKNYVDQVTRYKKRSVSIMTCHSGGLLNDFAASGERTVVLASSTCAESSYDAPSTCDDVVQAEFDYVQPNGLRRKDVCGTPVAADGSGDGFVSFLEAQTYNAGAMTRSTPQLGDPSSLAAATCIAKARP